MKVVVALNGEKCEGGSVIAVASTCELAREHAFAHANPEYGEYEQVDTLRWENEADFIEIEEHEVLGTTDDSPATTIEH